VRAVHRVGDILKYVFDGGNVPANVLVRHLGSTHRAAVAVSDAARGYPPRAFLDTHSQPHTGVDASVRRSQISSHASIGWVLYVSKCPGMCNE
jgi:hypothetical protein